MHRCLLSFLLLSLFIASTAAGALPAGFVTSNVGGGFSEPVGVTFDDNGRMYVWERAGRVWIVQNGVKLPTPLLDISDEVGAWRDYGMLGFALHPNFLTNGYIYAFYVVDHHHLEFAGTPDYDPGEDAYFRATIGRITRFTAQAANGFNTVEPTSRLTMLGESASTGCPILHNSHGVGSLRFGMDGTLLATCGDGASWEDTDSGGSVGGSYAAQGITEGIITPAENVGAYRAQLLSSLSGKILRLDPLTGDGVPSNPWFNAASPRAPASRVWALGLRNPYRFALRPESGAHDPNAADPGSLYIGDVGWNDWEEIQVAVSGGTNFGWPVFEGMNANPGYPTNSVGNLDAPNPLYAPPGCAIPFFRFTDLIKQETLAVPSFPNPCNAAEQIPGTVPKFMHRRPDIAYGHSHSAFARAFTGNNPVSSLIADGASPVSGEQFDGFTSTGGVWYTGSDFPAEYKDTYFHADVVEGWIANLQADANDQPTSIDTGFWPNAGVIVALATSPTLGRLYAVDFIAGVVKEIRYAPGGNQPPVAQASASVAYGGTPLSVDFSSAGSTDPEGLGLTYLWSFGDGTANSTLANPSHVFDVPSGVPTAYPVTLTVRDPANQPANAQVLITVNNTPPSVAVSSPQDQALYAVGVPLVVPLTAAISDLEQPAGPFTCAWQTSLHHNTHVHPEPVDTSCSSSAVVEPVGCDGNTYSYSFTLTVSDPLGLVTTRELSLFPDCAALEPVVCGDLDASAARDIVDVSLLRLAFANPVGNGLPPGQAERCSTIGGVECDVADLSVLRRYLAGLAPGPSAVCPAASP